VAEETKIQWTHHTFNPWRGCTKVSAGCANCYAETLSARNPMTLGVWGPNGKRVVASESYWREPVKWNKAAAQAGERRRVFCASLADVFEDWQGTMAAADGAALHVCAECGRWRTMEKICHGPTAHMPLTMDAVRQRLFDLIADTPHLDWLLLTKRPAVMRDWLGGPTLGFEGTGNVHHRTWPWPNVWLGVSVEDQKAAKERIPVLLDVPAAVHFLSCEPLLGEVDVSDYLYEFKTYQKGQRWPHGPVNWVIVGGESGHDSRIMRVEWARSLVKQCKDAGRACFVKQLGENATTRLPGDESWPGHDGPTSPVQFTGDGFGNYRVSGLRDKKGGDPAEWPADLRIREFPEVRDVGS